jgi:hypothetical protein
VYSYGSTTSFEKRRWVIHVRIVKVLSDVEQDNQLPETQELLKELGSTDPSLVREITDTLDKSRSSLKDQIHQGIDDLSAGKPLLFTPSVSPRKSPSKRPARELLVGGGSTPQKRRPTGAESPSKDATEDDVPTPPETPSKKRKTADLSHLPILLARANSKRMASEASSRERSPSPTKASQQPITPSKSYRQIAPPPQAQTTQASVRPTPSPQKPLKSPAKPSAPEPMQVDGEEEDEDLLRFRPVYHDHISWTAKDERVEETLKKIAENKPKIPWLEEYRLKAQAAS